MADLKALKARKFLSMLSDRQERFEKAKAELKAEIEKPFIKFLDWLENKLQRIEKWWHNG